MHIWTTCKVLTNIALPMAGSGRIDINRASVAELEKLKGAGITKAKAIADFREAAGGFSSLEDLTQIPGIGPHFVELNKNLLYCASYKNNYCAEKRETRRSQTRTRHGKHLLNKGLDVKRTRRGSASAFRGSVKKFDEAASELSDEDRVDQDLRPSPSKKICSFKQDRLLKLLPHKNYGTFKTTPNILNPVDARRHSLLVGPPPAGLEEWLYNFHQWSHEEKMYALEEIIESSNPSLVRHMMRTIEPRFQRDFISLLPKELALYVLSFLEPRDLLRAAQTCKCWQILCEDNLLWKQKCQEGGIEEDPSSYVKPTKRRSYPSSQLGSHSPSPYKKLYLVKQKIYWNWRCGPFRPSKILKGHDDHVITCLQFSGSRIVSGSDDGTLKVWSALTGKCLRTLVGHTGGVWSSQLSANIIVSGSTDRTLKVWNAETGQCIHTLYGHISTVRCMDMHENVVVSGSRDGTLRVWNTASGNCLHVLVGHLAAVRCVKYDGRRVVSGAYDFLVKVWDPETEQCVHTLQGHTNRVYSLQFDGTHIVSGSLDTSIRVWHVETGQCMHTLIGHQSLTSGMELRNNILVSGNADSTVKIWDITTGQCLQTLAGSNKHQSAVTCLQFNSRFVITSSDDGTVKIWDLQTGEFIRDLVKLDSGGSGGVVWRVKCDEKKLVCAVGSRNGTEETKLLVLDFDVNK